MHRDEPCWWYDERARVMPALLSPLSLVYGAIAGHRMRREPGYRSKLPVICIGNFTVGGSGKTPFTIYVCDWLSKRDRKPAILTRGYGGSAAGPLFVLPTHTARDVGDEALLLTRAAPTVVSRDRAAGARLIEGDPRGFDTIVMDDGFQNRSLAKSLSIVLVSTQRGLGNALTVPSGPLRAPLAVQKQFADVVVTLDGTPATDEAQRKALTPDINAEIGRPILEARIEPRGDNELAGEPVVAFCGIAGPKRFFATVEALGATIVERVAFRDHQVLSEAEASGLLARAQATGARLVTTEKDLARLAGATGARGALRDGCLVIPISVELSAGDIASLDALLARATGLS